MKTHTFIGVKYIIMIGRVLGVCDPPADNRPKLMINLDEADRSRRFLEIALHEALHACHFDANEDRVEHTARDISKFLWRLGYRKQELKGDTDGSSDV